MREESLCTLAQQRKRYVGTTDAFCFKHHDLKRYLLTFLGNFQSKFARSKYHLDSPHMRCSTKGAGFVKKTSARRQTATLIPDEESGDIPENFESFLDTIELKDTASTHLVRVIMNHLYTLTISVYLTKLRSCGIKSENNSKFKL